MITLLLGAAAGGLVWIAAEYILTRQEAGIVYDVIICEDAGFGGEWA